MADIYCPMNQSPIVMRFFANKQLTFFYHRSYRQLCLDDFSFSFCSLRSLSLHRHRWSRRKRKKNNEEDEFVHRWTILLIIGAIVLTLT